MVSLHAPARVIEVVNGAGSDSYAPAGQIRQIASPTTFLESRPHVEALGTENTIALDSASRAIECRVSFAEKGRYSTSIADMSTGG